MTMEPPPPTWTECHAAGLSAAAAAKARGLTLWAAYRWADRHSRRWPDQRAAADSVTARVRASSIARATTQALKTLPPEVHAWLVQQTPSGARLSETVAAILIDAYHEENDR